MKIDVDGIEINEFDAYKNVQQEPNKGYLRQNVLCDKNPLSGFNVFLGEDEFYHLKNNPLYTVAANKFNYFDSEAFLCIARALTFDLTNNVNDDARFKMECYLKKAILMIRSVQHFEYGQVSMTKPNEVRTKAEFHDIKELKVPSDIALADLGLYDGIANQYNVMSFNKLTTEQYNLKMGNNALIRGVVEAIFYHRKLQMEHEIENAGMLVLNAAVESLVAIIDLIKTNTHNQTLFVRNLNQC